jgi:hypothetical protein
MVYDLPKVLVSHIYGYVLAVPSQDQVFGVIVETHKGTPNTPVLVSTPQEMAQEFGISMDAYWGVGGQPLHLTRAIYQGVYNEETGAYPNPATKAVHYLYDTSTTKIPVIKLVARKEGTYRIFLSAGPNAKRGNDLVLEETNCPTEYFIGLHNQLTPPQKPSIQSLVERINDQSYIVDAYFQAQLIAAPNTVRWTDGSDFNPEIEEVVEGSDELELTGRVILGTGEGNSLGSDGVVKVPEEQAEFDQIPDANVGSAYRDALISLEQYRIAGVFVLRGQDVVHAEVATHVNKMNAAEEHGWRMGIVGAPDDAQMLAMIDDAIDLNNENIVYVGQGVVDLNGTEYPPRLATQVVAGKIGYTTYQYAIWGGNRSKILAVEDVKYIADVLPMVGSSPTRTATRDDLRMYNEHGVLTFRSDDDGVRIREGITTAQNSNTAAEDEIAVTRIVRHAKYIVYDKCYAMLGENISNTFRKDLEASLAVALDQMKSEGALIDVPEDGLSAYEINVQVTPRTLQRQGKVIVDISITPVHAARTISARIVVM